MSHRDSTERTGSFELILEEHAGAKKMGYGYNPYDTVPNLRDPSFTARHRDLRRLSEWIRTKNHVERLKESGQDEDPLP